MAEVILISWIIQTTPHPMRLQCFLKYGVPQDNPTMQKMIQYF